MHKETVDQIIGLINKNQDEASKLANEWDNCTMKNLAIGGFDYLQELKEEILEIQEKENAN